MEEKLINAVKNHEHLYNKKLVIYRNKFKRAAAWNAISKELNLPEEVCQTRWKSLRDKFVKKVAECHRASGSRAEVNENQWQYQEQLEFLREHVKRRRTVTSLTFSPTDSLTEKSPKSPVEDHRYENIESLADASFFEVENSEDLPSVSPTSSNSESYSLPFEVQNNKRKRAFRDCDSEAFTEFLNKMTAIAETRFATPTTSKNNDAHEGFFAMVRDVFKELPGDVVTNAKFFFLNYLHDQILATKKC